MSKNPYEQYIQDETTGDTGLLVKNCCWEAYERCREDIREALQELMSALGEEESYLMLSARMPHSANRLRTIRGMILLATQEED